MVYKVGAAYAVAGWLIVRCSRRFFFPMFRVSRPGPSGSSCLLIVAGISHLRSIFNMMHGLFLIITRNGAWSPNLVRCLQTGEKPQSCDANPRPRGTDRKDGI